jgi:hypothetical protein
MHRARNVCEEDFVWIVKASDFYAVADCGIGSHKLAYGLGRTAVRGRETEDDMKYSQKWLASP